MFQTVENSSLGGETGNEDGDESADEPSQEVESDMVSFLMLLTKCVYPSGPMGFINGKVL